MGIEPTHTLLGEWDKDKLKVKQFLGLDKKDVTLITRLLNSAKINISDSEICRYIKNVAKPENMGSAYAKLCSSRGLLFLRLGLCIKDFTCWTGVFNLTMNFFYLL